MRGALLFVYIFTLGIGYTYACGQGGEVVKENDKAQWLRGHNSARRAIGKGIPDLQWDQGLYEVASNYAKQLAQKCEGLVHSKGNNLGENLAAHWGSRPTDNYETIVGRWVKEKEWYDYKTNSSTNGRAVGHYTQVVWRNTSFVGCGVAQCRMKNSDAIKRFYVCNYKSPGNYRGVKPY